MKIYTITHIKSNICEVETFVYSVYINALRKFYALYSEHNKEWCTCCEDDENKEFKDSWNESISKSETKHFAYDNGDYFISVDFLTHEV